MATPIPKWFADYLRSLPQDKKDEYLAWAQNMLADEWEELWGILGEIVIK